MIKPTYLNIYVPELVKEICKPSLNSTISSNAAKLIGKKLARLPDRYTIDIQENPVACSFNLRLALDSIVYAKLSELAIVANLSIGETCVGLICETFEWSNLEPKIADAAEEIQLEIGCLRLRQIGNHSYWYWRYYTTRGNQADVYMHKHRDRALARAKSIGIPDNANPKYRRRCTN